LENIRVTHTHKEKLNLIQTLFVGTQEAFERQIIILSSSKSVGTTNGESSFGKQSLRVHILHKIIF
jgi:hypothetical protein